MWMCVGVEKTVTRGGAERSSLAGKTDWPGKREGKVCVLLMLLPCRMISLTNRLLQDANLSNKASSHALEVVKTDLQRVEEELGQEREAAIRAKVSPNSTVSAMSCDH